jgi:hypothetical protein
MIELIISTTQELNHPNLSSISSSSKFISLKITFTEGSLIPFTFFYFYIFFYDLTKIGVYVFSKVLKNYTNIVYSFELHYLIFKMILN